MAATVNAAAFTFMYAAIARPASNDARNRSSSTGTIMANSTAAMPRVEDANRRQSLARAGMSVRLHAKRRNAHHFSRVVWKVGDREPQWPADDRPWVDQ